MSKFYGGGGVEGHATLRRLESAEPGSHLARHPTPPGSTYRIVPASTYQGPSREGVSGERAAPDSGTARPFDEHEYAEQMRRGFEMKYGSPHAAERKA